ncbi:nitroreductase family protein [Chryseolinea lacunae]|uniref:Nitroreductase family protein n=1 Tax=Chryseolinea lacunae TaxID=2801331 RepID=A0ABS1KNL2_9BACT|nr:nitroreductase family protein [Chryseolinea lacunae]
MILIAAPKENEWAALDIGMCAQNIMLSASAAGLCTCPVGLGKFIERTNLYSLLDIADADQVLIGIALGYGAEKPKVPERKKENVFYVRHGVRGR